MKNKSTVLVLGSYGRGNVGDDIFLVALSSLLNNKIIVSNIADKNLVPNELSHIKLINTDYHYDVLKKIKYFIDADWVIYGGGDLWVELYGDAFPRKSLWKMLAVNFISRILFKKVLYVGCGAGNLDGFSLILAKLSAKLSNFIITREDSTVKILNLKNDYIVLPDLAVNLFSSIKEPKIKNESFKIGIAPLYYIPDPEKNFNNLVDEIAASIYRIKDQKVEITLFPMLVSNDPKNDLWVCNLIKEKIGYNVNVSIFESRNIFEIIDEVSKLDIMIGVRLHANIVATLLGVPSIGISYRPKVQRFFDQINLSNYCLEFNDLGSLESLINEVYYNYSDVSKAFFTAGNSLINKKNEYKKLVEKYIQ